MELISEWSLMLIRETPECENLPGSLVMNKSIVVAVPAVIQVGLWITVTEEIDKDFLSEETF